MSLQTVHNQGLSLKNPITNLSGFMDWLEKNPVPDGKVGVFRGHSDEDFKLQPSVFRNPQRIEREHLLLRELIAAHPAEFSSDESTLEQLVRMQHFSLPTRLLDVTWNPLVGLYFATEIYKKQIETGAKTKTGKPERKTIETDGQLIRIVMEEKLVRYFDSDRVSCVANLARCTPSQKQDLRSLASNVGKDSGQEQFNTQPTVKRLLHFIRGEKPAFDPEIEPEHLSGIYLVKPKMNNRRILAQEGAFLTYGLEEGLHESGTSEIRVERLLIPSSEKRKIRRQLATLSVNERTLFPEIERAARYLTDELETSELLGRGAIGQDQGKEKTRLKMSKG